MDSKLVSTHGQHIAFYGKHADDTATLTRLDAHIIASFMTKWCPAIVWEPTFSDGYQAVFLDLNIWFQAVAVQYSFEGVCVNYRLGAATQESKRALVREFV